MRLIDKSKLIQDIRSTITEQSSAIDWLNLINRQPTAYDVDKVVEQLEDENKKCSICELPTCKEDESHCCYCNGLNKAIEIVKAGGIDER